MKTQKELEKEFNDLSYADEKVNFSLEVKLSNGIYVKHNIEVSIVLGWEDGVEGYIYVIDSGMKDVNCLNLDNLAEKINKEYNKKIEQFCDDSDEFEKAGGEVTWW